MKIDSKKVHWYINHLKVLQHLSGVDGDYEAERVYMKLLRLETKASRWNEQECNDPDIPEEEVGRRDDYVRKSIKKLLPFLPEKAFMYNGDPRGYALKVRSEYADSLRTVDSINIYQDMGGYGILAPDFN